MDLEEPGNRYSHITNNTINKKNRNPDQEIIDMTGPKGMKWTLDQFWAYLQIRGADKVKLWKTIKRIITLSLISLVGEIPVHPHCYEIIGYDIVIDSDLKPWLLEANRSPAMAIRCKADDYVKTPMLTGVFKIMKLDEDHIR